MRKKIKQGKNVSEKKFDLLIDFIKSETKLMKIKSHMKIFDQYVEIE